MRSDAGDRDLAELAQPQRQVDAEQQRDRSRRRSWPRPTACRARSRSRARSAPGPSGDAAAHAGDLGRLADERPERRDVAQRVAADDRVEGVGEAEPVRRLDAQHPRGRARGESQAAEQHENPCESPADLRGSPSRSRPGPCVRTSHTKSAVPAAAVSRPVAVTWRSVGCRARRHHIIGGLCSRVFPDAGRGHSARRRAAVVFCRLSRLPRSSWHFSGSSSGALFASSGDGQRSDALDDWRRRCSAALLGALILIAAYFVGVALIGAGLGARRRERHLGGASAASPGSFR